MVAPSVGTALINVLHLVKGPCRFLFKNELLQPSGSFKLRGMARVVAQMVEKHGSAIHVYTSSGGNAGLAAAYASRHHGVPCTVVVPEKALPDAVAKLGSFGAEVIKHGAHWGEADAEVRRLMQNAPAEVTAAYCHPFDDPVLWDGHGDIIDETVQQLAEMSIEKERLRGVVCSAGGGGLYNGIVEGLKRQGLTHTKVLALETGGAASFQAAIDAGKVVTLPAVQTVALLLGAPYVAEQTLANYKLHPSAVAVISDKDAVAGAIDYLDVFGGVVEPACGATVAAGMRRVDLLNEFGPLETNDVIVFVICGGSGVTREGLESLRKQFGL